MKRENIESLYELTPLQHGMLFQTLYAPESGVYAVQLNLTLEGRLHLDALVRAFNKVMERHSVLRTAFYWQDLEKPLQVVCKQVDLPLHILDWSELPQREQAEQLAGFLEKDSREPFVFTAAPVMRINLIQLDEQTHKLIWTFHHVLLDGWSLQNVLQELWKYYEAYQAGEELNLRPSRPFRDYLAWLQRQDDEQAEAYWRKALEGFVEPTPLPLAYGERELVQGEAHYAFVTHTMSPEIHQRLQAVARKFQVTLNTVLQGMWALYLSRACGEADVVFGSTVSGRPTDLVDVERMAGMFINTLPMRVRVDLDAEAGPWLKELQAAQLEARSYEHSPMIKVQEWSEVPRGLRLFESLFVFENFMDEEAEEESGGTLKITEGNADVQTSLPLTLTVYPSRELVFRMQYDTTRYDAKTVQRMLGHLSVMLNGLAAEPAVKLSEIPILSDAEGEEVLVSWNATQSNFPRDRYVHQYVEAHAANRPDALAVVAPEKAWTYGELNAYANRLAHFLKGQGAGPERVVGVCLERSPELVAAYLAVWKTGAAFLMIDPNYPGERIRFMLDDAGAELLLTQQSLQEHVSWAGGKSCCLDTEAGAFAEKSTANLPTVSGLRDLSCVLYTSGSTGTPKGVGLEQESILNYVHWYVRFTELTETDHTTHTSGMGFDGTLLELFPALLAGCTIHQPDEETRYAPQHLQEWLLEQQVTVSYTTMALTEALIALEWPEDTTVRMHMTGGEAMRSYPRPELPFKVINGYGPTEATVYATAYEVPTVPIAGQLPSIGRPLTNMSVYVLDASLHPLPVGMPGELYVGGVGVGRGYLNRPELTAEKFLDTKFGRLYRTGDKVRWLPDGNLEYLGRLDQLVKIRGFRIELGEIEAALLKQERIQDAAVLAQDGQLLAYVAGSGVPTPQELRRFLQESLPEFMLPAYFVAMDALPLTANGKVNRRALPRPGREHAAGADVTVAARTQTERKLVEIWQKVLRLEGVGVTDNFFALGGHSLLATQVMGQMAAACGVELPLRLLFELPTIEALAKLIDEKQGVTEEVVTIQPIGRDGRLPLSFAQERLWFMEQFNANSAAYNVPMALRMAGALDTAALERSFNEIMARHEALRTSFVVRNGQPEQVIVPEQEMPFERVDFSSMPAEFAVMQAALEAIQEGDTPFQLTEGALVRAKLVRIAAEDHVLLLTMHHIISDGWSMGILIEELSKLYAAFTQGAASPLAPLPIQYADYAHWQREWLQGDLLEEQLAYWKKALQGAPSVLQLPTDRPRPAVQTFAGATKEIALSAELVEALKRLSQQEGATLFMALTAAFNVLLSRYSGQEDIVIGSPIAGRTRPETHGLIGFFVNTLALRTDLSGAPSFRELLGRVRETTLGAYAHQDLPFERLVQEVRPERDLSHAAIFQVLLALQNAPMEDLNLTGLTWRDFPVERGTAKFDLSLIVQEEQGGLAGMVEYNTDLFEDETIARMIENFRVLLESLVAAPEASVFAASMITAADRDLLLGTVKGDRVPFDEHACAHHLFERQAEQTPDGIAVEDGEVTLTYRELNERANRLAHRLQKLGVGPERLAAIAVERGPEMIVGLLGVLKAGGAYVPIDPSYPAERIAYQLQDGNVSVLLTQSHLAEELPHEGAAVICLDAELFEEESSANPHSAVQADNLAYVIYTSGSTGKPKGVLTEHRSVVNFTEWFIRKFDVQAGSRSFQFSSFSFDASVIDIYPTLCAGATLVLFKREDLLPGPQLNRLMREKRVNRMFATPSMMMQLPSGNLPDLHTVLIGGEAVSREVVQLWQAEGRTVYNGYGPTETTVFATVERCDGESAPPIGRPVQNAELYVLDANGQPVPIGVPGELYIGGAGVARGYLNRADLTAEKFVETAYGRLYRTGDAVRWLANGSLEYFGRIDQQVKIRGFRVELGEIEAVLRQHSAVQDAAVLALQDETGDKQLVGYVAVGEQEAPSTADLRAHLKAVLPEFMVPGLYVMMDALPLTVNRKVDRAALPAPELGVQAEAEVILPRTPVEAAVAGVWQTVLRRGQVGVQENFFELGGHSLLATQVMAHLAAALQVELPLRTLFESPTVEGLAAVVEQKLRETGTAVTLPMLPVPRGGRLPLSFAQERLWFFEQFHRGTATYNMPFALRLKGRLNENALRAAFDEIVRRHEVLRTSFAAQDGEAVQVIAEDVKTPFAVLDLTGMSGIEREMQAVLSAIEEGDKPFDLTSEPMLRTVLLRMDEAEHVLLITMHHIASDGWSMGILIEELSALYGAFAEGRPTPLAPLPVQYADYASWQRQWFQGEVLEEQLGYWKRQLQDAPFVLQLPTDKPRPAVQTYNGATKEVSLAEGMLPRLHELSRQEGVTLFMTLLAAFNTLLSRMSGQEDLLVGTPIAGRTRKETEGLIGFFVNTLALRTDLSGRPSFRELLGRVRETTLGAYAHQDLPFERLVREVHPERDTSYAALFQVMFALQNAPLGDLELPGLTLTDFPVEKGAAMFDLTFSLYEGEQGLQGSVQYNTDLFEEETVERIIERFGVLLEGIVSAPDLAVAELPVLTEAERGLLVQWNETSAPYRDDLCLHQLFEAQAERTPDAVAAEGAGRTLTYRQLNEQANRIARVLREKGVGPEQLVAIAVERTPEMAVAVLAVLKAGGAYVPLDPAYPSERLAYMLEDSQAKWLLTEESLTAVLPASKADVVLLDADWSAVSAEPVESGVTPDHLAYVIYTSGSTGRPKGTLLMHRGVVNHVEDSVRLFGWTTGDRVLKTASFSFDATATDLWVPLASGATVCFAESTMPGPELNRLLREQRINGLLLSPSALAMLPEAELPELHTVWTGGEVVSEQLIARFGSGRKFLLFYGPTEASVAVTAMHAKPGDRSGLLGSPTSNVKLYVLDAHLQPVPIGVPGELHVAGVQLARGYLNRPELTAEKFIEVNGERLYKTGDLVRWLPDGKLEFCGRVDDQVKLRGFRIELGEIEALLRQCSSVQDAAVILREDRLGDPRLVGYVTGDDTVRGSELREMLAAQLPEYMVPSGLVVLEAFPLTPNGKIDRRALPAPAESAGVRETEFVAPRDAAELLVSQIYADLLGVPKVGATDSFFSLGGHSLLAVRLSARLLQTFGQEIPLAHLFQQPTVEGVANYLRQGGQVVNSPLVQLAKGEGVPLFCVHAVGGSALSYLELANAFKGDQPLYAFQARGVDGGDAPFADIEKMAACYAVELVKVQPEGPIHLGGWSFGGAVAYEMARQLQAQGRVVASLVLFDSYAPTLFVQEEEALPSFAVDLAGQLGVTLLPEEAAELSGLDELHKRLATDLSVEQLTRLYTVFQAHAAALTAYTPQGVLSVPTTLFLSETSAKHPLAPTLGWGELVARVEVQQVEGDHFTMLKGVHAEKLKERLRFHLQQETH